MQKTQLKSNSFIFTELETWAKTCVHFKDPVFLEIIKIDHADPPCMRVDIFSKKYSGRVTLRLDGICDAEVIECDTEKQVFYRHLNFLVDKKVIFIDFVKYFIES